MCSWNLLGRSGRIPVEEWGREAGGKAAPAGRVTKHVTTVGDGSLTPRDLWQMAWHTHLSFPTPGTGELGYLYPNTHQSVLEGCSRSVVSLEGARVPAGNEIQVQTVGGQAAVPESGKDKRI